MAFLFFLVGAVVGSFLGALSWRWPREVSIMDGRSRCPHCKHTVRWFDNIPLLSFLLLRGRCRDCGKPIPKRDLYIEAGTALLFAVMYTMFPQIVLNLPWLMDLPIYISIAVFFVILSLAIAIFIIDLEHQYIPDTLAFLMLAIVLLAFLAVGNPLLFRHLAAGLGAAVFLLIINLATLGRGMGLGDVKLALAIGAVLSFPLVVVWMFLSFVLGSIVGLILIFLKVAKFKQRIAFGPFLIAGFLLTMVFGDNLLTMFDI